MISYHSSFQGAKRSAFFVLAVTLIVAKPHIAIADLGFALNPFYAFSAITGDDSDDVRFSGEISYFHKQNYELAVPLFYSYLAISDLENKAHSKVESVDVVLRKYAGNLSNDHYQKYLGIFVRYTGLTGPSWTSIGLSPPESELTTSKYGVGLNLGIRKFYKRHLGTFYWGASLFYGKYLTGKHDIIKTEQQLLTEDHDSERIFDFEFAKIGYLF